MLKTIFIFWIWIPNVHMRKQKILAQVFLHRIEKVMCSFDPILSQHFLHIRSPIHVMYKEHIRK